MPDVPHLVDDSRDQMDAALAGHNLVWSLLRHVQKLAWTQDEPAHATDRP
jgi:hypothetical protein